jgi:hypothetical protein
LQRLYVALSEVLNFVFHNFPLPHTAALVGAAEGCDLLILIFKNKIKRSQPRCTRQLQDLRGRKKTPWFRQGVFIGR